MSYKPHGFGLKLPTGAACILPFPLARQAHLHRCLVPSHLQNAIASFQLTSPTGKRRSSASLDCATCIAENNLQNDDGLRYSHGLPGNESVDRSQHLFVAGLQHELPKLAHRHGRPAQIEPVLDLDQPLRFFLRFRQLVRGGAPITNCPGLIQMNSNAWPALAPTRSES